MEPQSTESVTSVVDTTATFEQQVNQLAGAMKKDSNGKYQLPEGKFSEELSVSAKLERRRRNIESSKGDMSTKLKALQNTNSKLMEKMLADPKLNISEEESNRLSKLKFDDPDAWHVEMTKLESGATNTLKESMTAIGEEASQQAELDDRKEILARFNEENPSIPLTDEYLEQELPPRFFKSLEAGDVSFEQFLTEALAYIKNPKVIKDVKAVATPNLGKSGGGSQVSATDKKGQMVKDYKNIKF